MRIGMSPTTSHPLDGSSKALFDNLQAQVELMAELGFASISIGDHHVTRDNYLQVLPTMCRLSAHAGDMQLIPLFLLPFYQPILLAEQVAMLDVMSGGRTTHDLLFRAPTGGARGLSNAAEGARVPLCRDV